MSRSHGKSGTRVYHTWMGMRMRCYNPNETCFQYYGGRGIKVEWENFEEFYLDMGDPPSNSHTIERIDNDKNYSKENCRWASRKEQSNNRRSNVLLTVFGKTQTMTAWSQEFGIGVTTVFHRLARGWDAEKALTEPPRQPRFVSHGGMLDSVSGWSRRLGVKRSTIRKRLSRGLSVTGQAE